jgi:hypothetical protein
VNGLICGSFDIEILQPRFVGAEEQSAMAQRAVKAYAARATDRTSTSQSAFPVGGARFDAAKLEVAIAATIKALAVFKDAIAESKGPISLSVPRAGARQRPWWL